MSSDETTPTSHLINRVDILFSVASFQPKPTSPPAKQPRRGSGTGKQSRSKPSDALATTTQHCDSTHVAFYTDPRLLGTGSGTRHTHVHSAILAKALSLYAEPFQCRLSNTITLDKHAEGVRGMAVNGSETLLALSSMVNNTLTLYALSHGSNDEPSESDSKCVVTATLQWRVGKKKGGSGSGQFQLPKAVCFCPDDSIIVTDDMNNRLQEFGVNGKLSRVLPLPIKRPHDVCMSHDRSVIAVGAYTKAEIALVEYKSGEVMRVLEPKCPEAGTVYGVNALRFVPDDSALLCYLSGNDTLTLVSVADGSVLKQMCSDLTAGLFTHHIEVMDDGVIIFIDDSMKKTVSVWSSDGVSLLHNMKYFNDCYECFDNTWASCLVKGRLYVMDEPHRGSGCVRVFQ